MNNTLLLLQMLVALAYMDIKNIKEVDAFDYFKLTLIYPSSVCRAYNDRFIMRKTKNFCKIPVDATPWTIHGLWPDGKNGSFPQFCGNFTKKFVLSKLLPIRQKLERNWPNLFVSQSVSSLWKHEWEKHGTCAGAVEEVSDEVKYFNKTLALYEKFDIFRTLEKHKIIPSEEKSYDSLSLHEGLRSAYGGNVEFHCLQEKKTKNWLLADVRLCLTKDFEFMDCKERPWKWQSSEEESLLLTYQVCPTNGIVYLPFSNAHAVNIDIIIIFVVFLVLYLWNYFPARGLIFLVR